ATLEIAGFTSSGWVSVFIAVYTVAAHTSGRPRAIAVYVFTASMALLFTAGWFDDKVRISEALSSAVFLLGAYLIGDNLRRRRVATA
ncbi:MAG TPA: hypothetical protein PLV68_17875, partial [Ilumatobacteraceae bacterium]|nr:hypothetical protein [Ilumatobacteraceae bacterium]